MRWFRRARQLPVAADGARGPAGSDADISSDLALVAGLSGEQPFVCSQCGRTDLPPAGDWDPPICWECDAAVNFDVEVDAYEEG